MRLSEQSTPLVLLCALLHVAGCGDDRTPPPGDRTASTRATRGYAEHPLPTKTSPQSTKGSGAARIVRVEPVGEGAAQSAFRAGEPIEAGAVTSVGDARLVLELAQGARVELEPRSIASIGSATPSQIVLASGTVRGVVPPVGSSAAPPLRIATPASTVAVDGSADVLVTALRDGTTWLAVLQGRVRVLATQADERGKPLVEAYVAGQAVRVGGPTPRASAAPARLDAARAKAIELEHQARAIPEPQQDRRLEASLRDVDTTAAEVEAELARGAEATRAHRAAVKAHDRGKVWAQQQTLVAHAQAITRFRELLLVRWERVLAAALARDPRRESDSAAAIRDRSMRIVQLLGG